MDIVKLVSQMTLEEKAGLCSGLDFWHTKPVERLNIPNIMVADGPHGLRKQEVLGDHLGINESIKAVCFPTGSAVASSFDRDLIRTVGEALGDECQAEEVNVILGPALNIKRSPLCGRNFEYLSEDPYVSSEMAANHIKGVQSKNVGTSPKHFLANNQEYRRMTSSSEIDERTLREIYLAAFEGVIVNAKPWTVMSSYNKINGVFASENKKYLTDILRDEWNFDGIVISDWCAVNDRVMGLAAGLELEMPYSFGINDAKIVKAVQEGELDEAVLDQAVTRILNIVFRSMDGKKNNVIFDKDKHHELARMVEEESMVLLKNDSILPLSKDTKITFIGKFADEPRYQGCGSSHINSYKVVGALEAVKAFTEVNYAKGYETKEDITEETLFKEAVEAAKASEVAVIFAGLPDTFESEGYDRTHMSMPKCQNDLIEAVCAVQPNTVVVLHNGSPVEMPWANKVKAILEVYLGGQAVGEATVNVLFGKANPCGKLAETFPLKLEDNPSYLFYKGEKDVVEYREGIFVGYRYYDKKNMDVLFPFGHGLSYTTFEYTDLRLNKNSMKDTDTVTVTVKITNTGSMAGKEIVQLYVSPVNSSVIRPTKELKGFDKVYLQPGETKTVTFELSKRAFAYYNTEIHDWYVEAGSYHILVGKSSRNIECKASIELEATVKLPQVYSLNSTIGDIMADPNLKAIAKDIINMYQSLSETSDNDTMGESTSEVISTIFKESPLRSLLYSGGGLYNEEDLIKLVDRMNQII